MAGERFPRRNIVHMWTPGEGIEPTLLTLTPASHLLLTLLLRRFMYSPVPLDLTPPLPMVRLKQYGVCCANSTAGLINSGAVPIVPPFIFLIILARIPYGTYQTSPRTTKHVRLSGDCRLCRLIQAGM